MKNNKNGKIYYSFDEIGQELFGMKPYTRVTKDKQKLAAQQEKFLGTCPYCGEKLKYIYGTNVLACVNEDCRGKKYTTTDENGEEVTVYRSYHKILSDKGLMIGTTIFDEKEKK